VTQNFIRFEILVKFKKIMFKKNTGTTAEGCNSVYIKQQIAVKFQAKLVSEITVVIGELE
jgi:hypothetical protein